ICYATLRDGRQVTLRDYCRSDVLAKLPAPGEPITLGIDAQDVVLVADQ
ncbi:MAG: polyamine ABC transporter ATP-binding protein, partial [Mesorhizobium sp.]